MKLGFGRWDSTSISSPKWRRILERIGDAGAPDEERRRLARRVLRDGSDRMRCMVFDIYARIQMDTRGGLDNVLEPLIGALRVQAVRILNGAPDPEGLRDEAAMAIVWFAPKPRDVDLLLRLLRDPVRGEVIREQALFALSEIAARLYPDQQQAVLDWAGTVILDPAWGGPFVRKLAITLSQCPQSAALDLLRQGATDRTVLTGAATFAKWLLDRDPSARPLAEARLAEVLALSEGDAALVSGFETLELRWALEPED